MSDRTPATRGGAEVAKPSTDHLARPAVRDSLMPAPIQGFGVTFAQIFRKVTLPLIQSALVSGLTFAFARSMTTLSPIVFLTTPGIKIMTSQILAEVDSGRFGNAFAYCTVLMIIVLSLILVINLLVRKVIFRGRTHSR